MRATRTFEYVTTDRKPVGRVERVEPGRGGGRKEFFPYRFDGSSYILGLNGANFPVYHADEVAEAIAAAQTVFFVEGEGKADALRGELRRAKSRAAVTTIQGGCKAPLRDEHLAALNGPRVIFLVDSDETGRKSARARADVILRRHPHVDIRIVDLFPDRKDGSDVADWLAEGRTLRELRVLVDAAPRATLAPLASAAVKAPPTFERAADILAESESDELPCVVDGLLLLGGTAILAGRPKGGKSTLAANLALAVARGESFLGRGVRRGPVLYLALEGARPGWRQLLRRLGTTDADDVYLYIGRAPEDALQWLAESIAKHHPVLVIIDTMQRLLRVRDGNDYAVGSNTMDAVIELSRTCGAALLMLHHAGKARHSSIVDEVMGSTAWAASVDTVIVLRKSGDRHTVGSEQRFGIPLEETVLQMDEETRRIWPAGPKREADLSEAVEAIVAYLRERIECCPDNPAVDEATIMEHVEGRTALKRDALRAAVFVGKIERSGTGKKGDPYYYSFLVPLVPTISLEQQNRDRESTGKPHQIEVFARSHNPPDPSAASTSPRREVTSHDEADEW